MKKTSILALLLVLALCLPMFAACSGSSNDGEETTTVAALETSIGSEETNSNVEETSKASETTAAPEETTPTHETTATHETTVAPEDIEESEVIYVRDGNTVYFGEYPQSEVTDSSLTSTLNEIAGTLPTSADAGEWTPYGYYENGSVSDYMWYIDVEQGSERYRGVYFTSYRPHWTMGSSSSNNSYQDDNGYTTGTVYWFRYKPIAWSILSESDESVLLLCDMIIDSKEYYVSTSSHEVDGETIYANNYEYSTIRKWLNDTFMETAFTKLQREIILTTTVDNSAATTNSATNSYVCGNTEDKVFLLSCQEVTSEDYGFSSSYWTGGQARAKQTTKYAQVQGAWTSTSANGYWWLRSSYEYDSYSARGVYYDGYVHGLYVYSTKRGVVPALQTEKLIQSEILKFTSNGDDTCYVSGIGTCSDTDIIIPSKSPAGDWVTGIGDYAFEGCTSITSIVIPDGVTNIGNNAFIGCTSIMSITIPNSVTRIADGAFGGCSSLTSINIPDSVTSIGNDAFGGCTSLTSIVIPDSVASIGDSAFYGCRSLTSITIPSGVTSIGNHTFADCSSLKKITVDESNQYYKSIDGNLYSNDATVLIQYAIGNAETTFTVPDSVTSIGDYAFGNCDSLTSITIPDSVTSIGIDAFRYCDSFTTVYYTGTEEEWSAISIGSDNSDLTNVTIIYNYIAEK